MGMVGQGPSAAFSLLVFLQDVVQGDAGAAHQRENSSARTGCMKATENSRNFFITVRTRSPPAPRTQLGDFPVYEKTMEKFKLFVFRLS